MAKDDRYERLEFQVQVLTQRVGQLECRFNPRPAPPPPPPEVRARFLSPQTETPSLSGSSPIALDVTPSRVLAAAGGLVLLLGLGFLLRYAVARGWLGPEVRVLLGLFGSAALAIIGVRLERVEATRVVGQICTATASAGGYAAVLAAVVLYHLVPPSLGLLAAVAVAGAAVARGAWAHSQGIAMLGVGGALAAPWLVDAASGVATLAMLLVVLIAGLWVALRRRWPLLTVVAFVLMAPQLWTIASDRAPGGAGLTYAAVCGALFLATGVAAARGKDWTDAAVPVFVVVCNALFTGVLGYTVLRYRLDVPEAATGAWLAGVGITHGAAGVALSRRYFSPPIAVVSCLAAAVLIDAAVLDLAGGYAASLALWCIALMAAGALRVAWLRTPLRLIMAVQLPVLAMHALHAVVGEAPGGSAEAVLVVTALCAAAVAFATVVPDDHWDVAVAGGATLAGLAVLRLLMVEAPPSSILVGPADLGAALLMCAAVISAGLVLGWRGHKFFTLAAVAVGNYGVSLAAVALDPDGLGRVALTGLWAGVGGLALVAGRRRALPDVRRGGVALLTAAVTKAAVVDTTTLSGSTRAAALLLCGAALVVTAVAEARAAADQSEVSAATP